ncbi:glutamate-rich protein 4 [Microtus pennsylvanicus]|uniref:glutamate-rich protein 4 n=1 Tax=Microtus pennsylvanicus TaxID=10058 RepID=UPI003F6C9CA3
MELWVQLKQAGPELLGLGPLPQALRMPPPEGNPGQTLLSSGTELGSARGPLLWIWEELGNLRRVDFQLLGQLCHLGLEMGALREELITILEEEEEAVEEEEESCVDEEDEGPQGKQEGGHPGVSYPALCPPDFEITI